MPSVRYCKYRIGFYRRICYLYGLYTQDGFVNYSTQHDDIRNLVMRYSHIKVSKHLSMSCFPPFMCSCMLV